MFYLLNISKGCLSSEPLRPTSTTAEDPSVYWLPTDAIALDVPIWFCAMALYEDGLPSYPALVVTYTSPTRSSGYRR